MTATVCDSCDSHGGFEAGPHANVRGGTWAECDKCGGSGFL